MDAVRIVNRFSVGLVGFDPELYKLRHVTDISEEDAIVWIREVVVNPCIGEYKDSSCKRIDWMDNLFIVVHSDQASIVALYRKDDKFSVLIRKLNLNK